MRFDSPAHLPSDARTPGLASSRLGIPHSCARHPQSSSLTGGSQLLLRALDARTPELTPRKAKKFQPLPPSARGESLVLATAAFRCTPRNSNARRRGTTGCLSPSHVPRGPHSQASCPHVAGRLDQRSKGCPPPRVFPQSATGAIIQDLSQDAGARRPSYQFGCPPPHVW